MKIWFEQPKTAERDDRFKMRKRIKLQNAFTFENMTGINHSTVVTMVNGPMQICSVMKNFVFFSGMEVL